MNQSKQIKEVLDNNISIQEHDNVCIIGCGAGEIIEFCLNKNANLIVGLDKNPSNVETVKKRFSQMENVEITYWESNIYPRWINKFDLVVCMEDLCNLDNPRQFVRDVAVITRKSANFIVFYKDEQSEHTISELLYSNFMITSRTPSDGFYIIKSIKLPRKRL